MDHGVNKHLSAMGDRHRRNLCTDTAGDGSTRLFLGGRKEQGACQPGKKADGVFVSFCVRGHGEGGGGAGLGSASPVL